MADEISKIKYDGKKGVPVIRKPGNAVEVHTGLWGKLKPFVDPNKCIGCKLCFTYCPVSAIDWNNKKNQPEFDHYTCKSCGICHTVCPVKAIEMKEPKTIKKKKRKD